MFSVRAGPDCRLWGGKMSSALFSLRRYPLIFVVKTVQNRPSDDLASRWRAGPSRRPGRSLHVRCAMRRHTAEACPRARLAQRATLQTRTSICLRGTGSGRAVSKAEGWLSRPDTDGVLPPHSFRGKIGIAVQAETLTRMHVWLCRLAIGINLLLGLRVGPADHEPEWGLYTNIHDVPTHTSLRKFKEGKQLPPGGASAHDT